MESHFLIKSCYSYARKELFDRYPGIWALFKNEIGKYARNQEKTCITLDNLLFFLYTKRNRRHDRGAVRMSIRFPGQAGP